MIRVVFLVLLSSSVQAAYELGHNWEVSLDNEKRFSVNSSSSGLDTVSYSGPSVGYILSHYWKLKVESFSDRNVTGEGSIIQEYSFSNWLIWGLWQWRSWQNLSWHWMSGVGVYREQTVFKLAQQEDTKSSDWQPVMGLGARLQWQFYDRFFTALELRYLAAPDLSRRFTLGERFFLGMTF